VLEGLTQAVKSELMRSGFWQRCRPNAIQSASCTTTAVHLTGVRNVASKHSRIGGRPW
jgi:hypothetical protein